MTTTPVRYAPRIAPPGHLDAREWPHRSSRFLALHHDFGLRTNVPEVAAYFGRAFVDLSARGEPGHWYSIVDRGTATKSRYGLYYGDERISLAGQLPRVVSMLLWHVNQEVVLTARDELVCLHAAGAVYRDVGIVFPAPMESGKTTLVAGMVRAGARYLTDEAVAIEPATLIARPFPKPLSLDPGSWPVLPEMRRDEDAFSPRQWQVPVTSIRPDAVADPVRPRLLVAPKYVAGATTVLEPVSGAQMLVTLAESTFHLLAKGRRNLTTLGRLAETSGCYRLTVGSLDDACAAVQRLADDIMAAEPEVRAGVSSRC